MIQEPSLFQAKSLTSGNRDVLAGGQVAEDEIRAGILALLAGAPLSAALGLLTAASRRCRRLCAATSTAATTAAATASAAAGAVAFVERDPGR